MHGDFLRKQREGKGYSCNLPTSLKNGLMLNDGKDYQIKQTAAGLKMVFLFWAGQLNDNKSKQMTGQLSQNYG